MTKGIWAGRLRPWFLILPRIGVGASHACASGTHHDLSLSEPETEVERNPEATGLPAEVLVDTLRALVGPVNEDQPIHFVNHDPDQITIGSAWMSRCEDMGKNA